MFGSVKLFTCDNCHQTLYFENSRCVSCGETVAYDPDAVQLATLKPGARECRNALERDACNWLVTGDADTVYCRSCELSAVIPDLTDAANERAWRRIEAAKRRLLYTLFALKLPIDGLSFRFLKGTAEAPVMTGHDKGVITLNVDEADVAFRENMREKMGEAYRTVLGHLRHEIGHYYWDRLIARDPSLLEHCRALFGDERQSYADAITRHYGQGPPANWNESHISAYATMHPWEDWAETWAHYLHMVDTLETARSHGVAVRAPAGERVATDRLAFFDFDALTTGWNAVTLALNSLNRSMGLKDPYPFVLSPHVLDKLRFVHDVVQRRRAAALQEASAA